MDENRREELLKKLKDGTLNQDDERELWDMNEQDGIDDPFDDGEPDLDLYTDMEAPPEMGESLERFKSYHAFRVRRGKQRQTIYRVAASMAAVFLLYFGFTTFSDQLFFKQAPAYVTVEVKKGAVKQVALPDGSMATVSPGSVLRYPKTFATDERKVYLDKGEAFFEVAKNPEKPFRVASGKLQTTALGTSFTVQYDPIMQREKVNLYTGKVSVESVKDNADVSAVVLTPGKAYEYLAGKVILSDFSVDSGNPVARGLAFEDVPFDEAMYRISSWYGITITFDPKSTEKHGINGDFNNKDIESIFFILSNAYNLQFTKTDSLTYKIERK
ncbi:FecR family protein [Sphingobacterium spiritivorum]|uniref:FecR family protein n=1 Tax=Sphingobacterium spiritivorum TaxID=258 RepID=UPI003DA44B1B